MQPAYAPQPVYNNFSPQLLEKRAAWEKALGITHDEMLVFRAMGTGNTLPLQIKYTDKASENTNFEAMRPTPTVFIPSQESIIDRGAPGGFVQLAYFEGGYAPGKQRGSVKLGGPDETVIKVVPEANPALYDFLTFSPRLKDGPIPSNVAPQYELLRPDQVVEGNWEDDQKLAAVIMSISTASLDTLKWLAPKLSLPAETSTEQRMRKNFSDYAKASAAHVGKLDALFQADETRIYQQVEKAIGLDVVQVNREKAMWVFGTNQDPISPASPDRNTLDQLVGYLLLEAGQTTYKQILSLTAKAESQKKK